MDPKNLVEAIDDRDSFGDICIASAPGRVNLIGEHTDYNEGFVLPCAINLRTYAAAKMRKDKKVKVVSLNLNIEYTIDNIEDIKPSYNWWSYIIGCSYVLDIKSGFNIAVFGEVPIGGGLSSSASLEVASLCAISKLFGIKLEKKEIAFLCKKVENEFVGVPCGIMDQLCSAMGEKQHALLIDCRTYDIKFVKFPYEWKIIVCDSGIKHELGSSEYKNRQEECKQIVKIARQKYKKIKSLRDIDMETLQDIKDSLDSTLYKRAKFIIEENQRVIETVSAILDGDQKKISELFKKSHLGLSEDYQVSCRELDTLVQIAYEFPGLIGARMTGGGFGGNTINIVEKGKEQNFIEFISDEYQKETGRKLYPRIIEIDNGVSC